MTLPDERYRSILQTRKFLRDLLDPKKTPRISYKIRQEAARCLRHFPWNTDLNILAIKSPDILQANSIDEE